MIEGVETKKLRINVDERGFLMEMLRSDDSIFKNFGQAYMTMCKRGVAKAWHFHKKQDDFFICVYGEGLVVLFDNRKNSKTFGEINEFTLKAPPGESILLKIPVGVVHGFTSITEQMRIINIPTELYNYKEPDEFRLEWNSKEVPYKWPNFVERGG